MLIIFTNLHKAVLVLLFTLLLVPLLQYSFSAPVTLFFLVLSWWLRTSSAYYIPCIVLSEVLTKEHASTYVSLLDFVMKFLGLLSYFAFGFITVKEDCFFFNFKSLVGF